MAEQDRLTFQEHWLAVPLAFYEMMKSSSLEDPFFTVGDIAIEIGPRAVPSFIVHSLLLQTLEDYFNLADPSKTSVSDFDEDTEVQLSLDGLRYVEKNLLFENRAKLMRSAAEDSVVVKLLANLHQASKTLARRRSRFWKSVHATEIYIPVESLFFANSEQLVIEQSLKTLEELGFLTRSEDGLVAITEKGATGLEAFAACIEVEPESLVDIRL
jgi:hypothetical protein